MFHRKPPKICPAPVEPAFRNSLSSSAPAWGAKPFPNPKDTSLGSLATRTGRDERTFLRRVQKATGLTATENVQRLRVSKAQELLQSSTEPVDRIAWAVGEANPSASRKVFIRIVGLTPNTFRRRFKA